ncbi:MAG: restriction endonuclease subunit S [Desulfobulbus sp.]|nr:restriction endonuclease subunit S [Desulfobulbus sp.]
MAVCSSVSISQVEYLRFDADFYHPKYLQELKTWRTLDERVGVAKLSHLIITPVRTGRTPSSRHIKEEDEIVPFIKTDGIREGRINFDSAGELPKRVLNESDFIPADSVVVTIIGATPEIVGRAAIVREADSRCVTNQNVAVITTNSKCDPYFLTAYFQTSFGRDQLWRHSRRTEQVNLNCREVERVLVPTPDISLQSEIGDFVRASFAATDDSESLYTQAQQLLESELGLDKLCFDKPVGYTARFSELELSHRTDAQHYQPRFTQLLEHLAMFPTKRIREIRRYNRRGIQPIYVDDGSHAVVNSQHLGPKHINYDGLQKTTEHIFNASPEAHIQPDDLLIYTTGAYIGRTNVYLDDAPAFASNHVNILRLSPDVDHAYMSMVFQSIIGQFQTQKHARGSAQAELYPADIDKFVVPLLPPDKQQEIGNLVRESLTKQRESAQLLDQAKSRVEHLIEEAVRA